MKNNFFKSVLIIAGGTAFAQIITAIVSPILTRIYQPEEFGVFSIFLSILGLICYLGSLSYESAIPIAEDKVKAYNVLILSIIILCLFSITLTFLLFFGGQYFLRLLNTTELVQFQYFIIIAFLVSGIYNIFSSYALRVKNYQVIAKTKYTQSLVGNGSKIAFGILGPIGLIFGHILGEVVGILNLISIIYHDRKFILKNIKISIIYWCLKRYVRFPKFSAPSLFIISLSSQLPIFFLSSFYLPDSVGYYGLAIMVTFMPMSLIGKSVQDVFYGEAASLGRTNPQEIKKLSRTLLKKLSIIGAIPMVTLIIFGPQLFSIVFGFGWSNSGLFASVLAIYGYTFFIFHPISTVFSIFEEQHLLLILNMVKIILIIIVFYSAQSLGLSVFSAIFMFSLAMCVSEFLKFLLAQRVLDKHIPKIL